MGSAGVTLAAAHGWSASAWVAFTGLLVAVGVAGYSVIRLNRVQRARLEHRRRLLQEIPEDLRFAPESVWFRVSGLAASLGAGALCAAIVGGAWAFVSGFAVVLAAFGAITLRRRAVHQRAVIASVEEIASAMAPDDLSRLVAALEYSHGRAEMRPLRRLIT